MNKAIKKQLQILLKFGVSIALLYFVFSKISLVAIKEHLKGVHFGWLLLSILFFSLSQWVSIIRLEKVFYHKSFRLSRKNNFQLYLLGMFYNFFIPGGIGGDAYKGYLLNKTFRWPAKDLAKTLLYDRLSGLVALVLWILLFLTLTFFKSIWLLVLCPFAILLTIYVAKYMLPLLIKGYSEIFTPTLVNSIWIQGFQVLSVFFICLALEGEFNALTAYLLVFLISSALSVLSFAGIGIREFIFLKASTIFVYQESVGISIAILFTGITAFVSLFGLIYHFKKPKLYLTD